MEVEKAIWDNLFLEKLVHTGCGAITELHFTNVILIKYDVQPLVF